MDAICYLIGLAQKETSYNVAENGFEKKCDECVKGKISSQRDGKFQLKISQHVRTLCKRMYMTALYNLYVTKYVLNRL